MNHRLKTLLAAALLLCIASAQALSIGQRINLPDTMLPEEKNQALQRMEKMLVLTRTDHPTGIANRLGGDEFTLLAHKYDEERLVDALAQLEKNIRAQWFGETGISYGIAHAGKSSSAKDMLLTADRRMYDNKTSKRKPGTPHARAWDTAPKMA